MPAQNILFILTILFACIIFVLILLMLYMIMVYKNCQSQQQQGHRRNNHNNHNKSNYRSNSKSTKNDPSGWQLYALKNCPHCTKQLEELKGFNTFVEYERGNDVPIINNIDGELYPKNKINGYPFWYNSKTGETKPGRQNICSLTPKPQMANCN